MPGSYSVIFIRLITGKEYKVLKRFRKISAREILDIVKDDDLGVNDGAIARVLCMAKMYGIEIADDCVFIYLLLDENWKCKYERKKEFFQFPEGSLKAADEILEGMFSDVAEMYAAEEEDRDFQKNLLSYFGCHDEYLNYCDEEDFGAEETFRKTLAMLKTTYPKREFTKDELLLYAQLWHAVSALSSVVYNTYDDCMETLGIARYSYFDDFEPWFKAEEVIGVPMPGRNVKANKPSRSEKKVEAPKENKYDEALLLQEIEKLRSSLHLQENANKDLRQQLQDSQRKLAEQEEVCKRLQEDKKELAVLRDYVYHFAEDIEPEPETDQEEMIRLISGKNIMIIGGNDNWTNKLRGMFPNWKFISPNASGAISSMQKARIDKAYFFTDTLAHSQYYKYMQVIRTRGIPFGYIHGVNVSGNVEQIFRDFIC